MPRRANQPPSAILLTAAVWLCACSASGSGRELVDGVDGGGTGDADGNADPGDTGPGGGPTGAVDLAFDEADGAGTNGGMGGETDGGGGTPDADPEPEMDANTSSRCTSDGAGHPPGPLPLTPTGRVMVLDANLKEAFDVDDVADDEDMKVFARRVRANVPFAPDVVLLQEVVGPSADVVARVLSTYLGRDYGVIIAPGQSASLTGNVRRDTAIVMNRDTMVRTLHEGTRDTGGFYRASFPNADASDGTAEKKDNAYIALREREDGGARLAVASMHPMPADRYVSRDVAWGWNATYAAEITDLLRARYTAANTYVVAGDWNNRRCETTPESAVCTEAPFWTVLTGRGYTDAVFSIHGVDTCMPKRIDYVFTTGRVIDADHDYTRPRGTTEGDDGYYSDHSFVWALVERL